MKEIEKRIRGLLFEMTGIVAFLIFTFFMWNNFNYEKEASIAYAYSNYNSMINTVITKNINMLFMIDDESSNSIEGIHFSISNPNSVSKEYNLYLKYDNRNSTLNIDYLKINYEGKIYNVKDLKRIEKENETFYLITTNKISKRSKEDKELKLFLDENTPREEQDELLSYTIYAEEK